MDVKMSVLALTETLPVSLLRQDLSQSFLVQFKTMYHGKRRIPYQENVLAFAFQTS